MSIVPFMSQVPSNANYSQIRGRFFHLFVHRELRTLSLDGSSYQRTDIKRLDCVE